MRSPAEYTLVLTLTDDAWRPEVGQEGEAASEALLASILAAQNEPRGWNAVVRPQLRSRELTRLSDAVVTLTLLQFMEYEVSMPETVGLVVPAESVVSAQPVTCCNASFVLMPERGRVALGGSALGLLSEGRLRHASEPSFTITLSGDTWAPNVTAPNSSLRRQLVAGISACKLGQLMGAQTAQSKAQLIQLTPAQQQQVWGQQPQHAELQAQTRQLQAQLALHKQGQLTPQQQATLMADANDLVKTMGLTPAAPVTQGVWRIADTAHSRPLRGDDPGQ